VSEFFRDDLTPEPSVKLTKESLEISRMPNDLWACSIDKIPDKFSYKAVLKDFIKNLYKTEKLGLGLYLYGPYGSGKSGAAVAIIKEAMRRGGRAIFLSSLELETVFGKNMDPELYKAALNTHFLIFDDVGAEKQIPWSPIWVETVVKLRNNNRLPTIITSNDDPVAFYSRIKSIASIMGGKYEAVKIEGIDWRLDPPISPKDGTKHG
jgi:DNA replication protein DnaC